MPKPPPPIPLNPDSNELPLTLLLKLTTPFIPPEQDDRISSDEIKA